VAKEQAEPGREDTTSGDDSLRCVVNPGGFTFRIGCFVAAPGCKHVGQTSAAFSWFPGWTWQIAICSSCHAHVGWIFRCGGDQFHGLITSALR